MSPDRNYAIWYQAHQKYHCRAVTQHSLRCDNRLQRPNQEDRYYQLGYRDLISDEHKLQKRYRHYREHLQHDKTLRSRFERHHIDLSLLAQNTPSCKSLNNRYNETHDWLSYFPFVGHY